MKARRYFLFGLMLLGLFLVCGLWTWLTWKRDDPEASFQRGLAAIKARDDIALHREIQILKRFPLFVHQMQLLRGTVLLDGGDYAAAMVEFSACSHEPQTQAMALMLAGETLCRTEHQGEAVAVLERSVELDPDAAEAHRWLAIACYDTGANSRAVVALKKVAQLVPDNYRPHRMLGMIQRDRERFTEAVEAYRVCLRLKPQDEQVRNEVRYELSDCLTKLNRYDEALKSLDDAPESADAQAMRANCHFGLGDRKAARKAAQKSLEFDPNHIEGRGWLATLQLESGEFKAAAENLEHVIAKYPAEFAPRFKLAQAYQRLSKKAEAEAQLAKGKELQALSLKFSELHDQASQKPKDAEIRFELGETAHQLDRIELARMWYRAALSLDPKLESAKRALRNLPQEKRERGRASGKEMAP